MKLAGIWKIFNLIKPNIWLILLITIIFWDTGRTNAKNIEGCYAHQDSTGNHFMVLQPQGDYKYYIRTSLDQQVIATGNWWQNDQSVFTQIITATIRDDIATSRLVEGSVRELKIKPNGNLVGDSKIYRSVECSDPHGVTTF